MTSKIPPSKRSPAAHKAANARYYQKHTRRILAGQRVRRNPKTFSNEAEDDRSEFDRFRDEWAEIYDLDSGSL